MGKKGGGGGRGLRWTRDDNVALSTKHCKFKSRMRLVGPQVRLRYGLQLDGIRPMFLGRKHTWVECGPLNISDDNMNEDASSACGQQS